MVYHVDTINRGIGMLSFHNDQAVKDKYVARGDAHILADELVQGSGWDGAKGCAVGCTLDNYNFEAYPDELGLPIWIAHLQDVLHEGQSFDDAKLFFRDFLRSIPVGKSEEDFENVKSRFLIFVLNDVENTIKDSDYSKVSDVLYAINKSKLLHENFLSSGVFDGAAAGDAARAARAAAWAAGAARDARDARDAARDAAWAAGAARDAAWDAAGADTSKKYADELIKLMKAA